MVKEERRASDQDDERHCHTHNDCEQTESCHENLGPPLLLSRYYTRLAR
jgi:hypothetical protein